MYDRILDLAARGQITKLAAFSPYTKLSDVAEGVESYGSSLLSELPHMVPFEVTNVADWLESELEARGVINLEDTFRNELMRLPFDNCWFEAIVTNYGMTETGGGRVGVAALSKNASEYALVPTLLLTRDNLSYMLVGGDCSYMVYLDDDGLYQRVDHSPALDDLNIKNPDMGNIFTGFAAYALYSIYLMHWRKSVQVVHVPPTRQQKRQAQREGKPPLEYKTINIKSWLTTYKQIVQQQPNNTPNSGLNAATTTAPSIEGGFQQRWHMVRGHKTTWTESAPQFGCLGCMKNGQGHDGVKSHVGTFWIRPHHAGRRSLGEIRHIYSVEQPK